VSDVIDLADPEVARERAVSVLQAGHLAVLPTDTVYAAVADAFKPAATQRLFGAKRRTRTVPLPVLVRSPRQVAGLVADVPEPAERLMATYWPGPLTIVFTATDGLGWDLGETRGTVALRMPADDLLLAVIGEVGPVAASAANRGDGPPPTILAAAREQLGESIALYIDGGHRDGQPSTVVDVTRGGADVLREGAVLTDHVAAVATGAVGWGERPEESEG
jgi:L-threonylcarbamoyladenylate synthase